MFKIIWDRNALNSLSEIKRYIENRNKSDFYAIRVTKKISEGVKKLSLNPYIYQVITAYKIKNYEIRSFIIYSYKIFYTIYNEVIIILDIIHTSQDPLNTLER